jgi:hypothetical protein
MTSDIWNGNGDWFATPTDWSTGAAPGASDDVLIYLGTDTLTGVGVAANIVIDNTAQQTLSVSGASASLTAANLTAYGNFRLDTNGGDGGSTVNITGTFANYSNAVIGNSGLSASVTMTVGHYGSYFSTGSLNLWGNQTLGTTKQATLVVNSAAPTVLLGNTYIHGDSLIEYQSGGITTIGANSELQIDGQQSRISIGAGTTNSALTGLAYNYGTFDLEGDWNTGPGGTSVTTTTNLFNAGAIQLDVYGGDGSSQLKIGGVLTNIGSVVVGNTSLSTTTTQTTLTVGGLVNSGSINLWGNQASGTTNQATLDDLAAAPSTWTGDIYIHGDSDVIFASGGITSIASSSEIQIDGQQARYSIGAGATNSALNGLASNYGTFDEEGDWSTGPGGASVTTSAAFTNYATFQLDIYGGDGASSFTDASTFTNDDNVQIGNGSLSAATTLTVASLVNNGTIFVDSQNTAGASQRASLIVQSAAPSASTGYLRLAGDSLIDYQSTGITSIASGATIELDGGAASIAIGAGAQNSALKTLSSNSGTLLLRGDNGFGSGVALTTTTAYANAGVTRIDWYGGDGGDTVNFGGALTNTDELDIGNQQLSANTTVGATAYSGGGSLTLQGNNGGSASPRATLAISGAASASVSGYQRVSGVATLSYGAGVGYTNITSAGWLELDGQFASITAGGGGQNSGIAGLVANSGKFVLRGNQFGVGGVSVTTTGTLYNAGILDVDGYGGGDGGSSLTLGGSLVNTNTVNIGNTSLSANSKLTATGLSNTGALTIQGATGSGLVPQAWLDITTTSLPTVSNTVRVSGNGLLSFATGSGFTSIKQGGYLELDGAEASITASGGGANSGLAALASNYGTLLLRGDSNYGQGGVAATITAAYRNAGTTEIDYYGGDGGSQMTFGGGLTNAGTMTIGNAQLGASTTVQAASLNSTGSLTLQGSSGNVADVATLAVSAAASSVSKGFLRIGGSATLSFGSGLGFQAIGNGGWLELDSSWANATIAGGAKNSALANLASNYGTLLLRGNTNFGPGGVTVTTSTSYTNSGTTSVDIYGGDGGSSLTFGGTLDNQGTINLGNSNSSAVSSIKASQLLNVAGQINITGDANVSTLSFTGAAYNYAGVYIGAGGQLSAATGFYQYNGSTTVNGTLSASAYTQYDGSTTVNGTLAAKTVNDYGGSVTFNAALTATSATTSLTMQNGAILQFYNSVSSSQTVTFRDASDILQLYDPTQFSGNVAGFVGGDAIDLMHQSAAASLSYSGGILSVLDSGNNVLESFKLGGGSYTTSSFSLVDDLQGGKLIYV